MAERYLILVRHGQYHIDVDHRRAGLLTALGRRQCQRVAKRLVEYPIDAIHCSTSPRAIETAQLIAERCGSQPPRRSNLLLEGLPTRLSVLSAEQRRKVPVDRARMEEALAHYFRPTRSRDRHELLVCHGNIIRYLLRRAMGDTPSKWVRMDLMHTGISMVRIPRDGQASLLAFNDVGHLPHRMHTFA